MQESNLARKIATEASYDLERFESTASPVISKVSKRGAKSVHPVQIMLGCLLAVGLLSTMLYSRVIISELNMKINAATDSLDELHSESVRMQTELESKMSLKNVEEIAVGEYGMVKPDATQVSYIYVNKENKIETSNQAESVFNQVLNYIEEWLNG